jgi:hypothetical protein
VSKTALVTPSERVFLVGSTLGTYTVTTSMSESPTTPNIPTFSEGFRREITSLILTPEQFVELDYDGSEFAYTFETGPFALTCFGADHSHDPQHTQLVQIEKIFTERNPELAIVEGIHYGIRERFETYVRSLSREEAVIKGGESIFTVWLALQKGILWHCPEPEPTTHIHHLEASGFSRDELLAYEIMHVLPQYHRQTGAETGFKDYATKGFIEHLKRRTQWPDFDYSYERGLGLAEAIVGHPIDVEGCDYNTAIEYITPIPSTENQATWTTLNEIAKTSSIYRDEGIVLDILAKLREHRRILAVYGSSHPKRWEPALREGMRRLFDTN